MPAEVEVSHNLELELPKDVIELARRQGEDADTVCSLIQELRDMIFERGLCKTHRHDDEYLIKFLRARFWKVENAYKLLCRYYEFREENLDYYVGVNPASLRCIGKEDIVSATPYLDQEGRRIVIYRIGNWKPSKIPMDDLFKATLILMELASLEPRAQIVGGIGIFDLEGLTLNHAWNMSPSVAKKIISIMVTCMPMRTVAIHFINNNWTFDAMFQIFKPFLNERMKECIFFHGSDKKSLLKHVHKEHLPIRYGGVQPESNYELWIDTLEKNPKIVKELQQLGYIIDPPVA